MATITYTQSVKVTHCGTHVHSIFWLMGQTLMVCCYWLLSMRHKRINARAPYFLKQMAFRIFSNDNTNLNLTSRILTDPHYANLKEKSLRGCMFRVMYSIFRHAAMGHRSPTCKQYGHHRMNRK